MYSLCHSLKANLNMTLYFIKFACFNLWTKENIEACNFWLSKKGVENMPTPFIRNLQEEFNTKFFKSIIFCGV